MKQNCGAKTFREIYAIKREISDEIRGMSPSEMRRYFHDGTKDVIARYGLKVVQSANTDKSDTKV